MMIQLSQMINFIRIADIGINSIFIKEKHEIDERSMQRILLEYIEHTKELEKLGNKNFHSIKIKQFLFKHKIAESYIDFPQELESAGTLQFLTILSKVLTAIKYGMTLILDEIEIKLHQNLVAYLIGLFQNPSFNTKGAQLVFSFHNSYLMNILEPHQLWFTQKNDDGETEVFSANDFKDISKFGKEHLEELYRIGRFGAIPRGI